MTVLATWGLLSLTCTLVLLALFAFDGLTEELHACREDRRRDTGVFDTVAAAQADFAAGVVVDVVDLSDLDDAHGPADIRWTR